MATEDEQFAAIFREIYPRLCRFLEGLLGDPGGAQDLAQETFLRLHRFGCERLPANESRFWLFRVARNLALNELTRRQTRTKFAASVAAIFSFGSPAAATPEEQLAQAEQAQLAARLLVILPADQRAALLLREQEGMSYAEIARALDISESKVKVDIFRARQTLRARWHELTKKEPKARARG